MAHDVPEERQNPMTPGEPSIASVFTGAAIPPPSGTPSMPRAGVAPASKRRVPRARGAAPPRPAFMSIPWPVAVFFLAILIPTDLSFYIGTLRLTGYRLVLLIAFVPCLIGLLGRKAGPLIPADLLMLFYVGWACVALAYHHGPELAFETGGVYILEGYGSYLVARVFIRDAGAFRGFAFMLVATVILLGVATVPEAITGNHYLRELSNALIGRKFTDDIGQRLGLTRAYGSFDHPILYGVFCASALGLSWHALAATDRLSMGRLTRSFFVGVSTVASVSSGALVSLMAQGIVIGWDRLLAAFRRRWLLFGVLFSAGWVMVDALSNRSAMAVFLSYLTFSPATAYNRSLIWRYGSAEVARHPLLGIGFNDWERPDWMHSDSMDSFWLVVAVTFGLPAALGLAISVLHTVFAGAKGAARDPARRSLYKGWLISMIGMCMAAATVHFWNSLFVYFCFLIGAGAFFLRPAAAPRVAPVRAPAKPAVL